MTNHIISIKACWWLVTVNLLFGSHKDIKTCTCVAYLLSSDKTMWRFTKMNSKKRKLANKNESAAKKQKVEILEVKLELKNKWSYRKNSWLWECWPCFCPQGTLEMQSEELSEGEQIKLINKESGCGEKNEDVLEQVIQIKTSHLRNSQIFNIESAKNKNVGRWFILRSMTIWEGIEKVLASYPVIWLEGGKHCSNYSW